MAPASKRRKRVVDSDDDDERPRSDITRFLTPSPNPKRSAAVAAIAGGSTPSPSPLKPSSRANDIFNASIVGTSPGKGRTRPQRKTKADDKSKTADLMTLFSNQARKPKSGDVAATSRPKKDVVDEIISDPITDDDDDSFMKPSGASIVSRNAQKRLRNGTTTTKTGAARPPSSSSSAPPPPPPSSSSFATTAGSAPNPSQMFVRPPKPVRPDGGPDDDLRPWSERFGPISLDELAVHKKKVADVRRWLEDVILHGRVRQSLLLLKGAAGTGKTTTVRLLARDMGLEILEWRNPTGTGPGGGGRGLGIMSPAARFESFLDQGGRFGSLDVGDPEETQTTDAKTLAAPSAPRLILIEEFPNTFTRSSTALTSFRNAVSGYLGANTPSLRDFQNRGPKRPITPIIMIVSETLLTTTSATADSFTAHRLLGPEILRHPGSWVVEFNPIAPSLLAKALELVVLKEARKSGRRRTPGLQVLKRLGEIGDIRNAVSSLEFLCLKGDQDSDWGAKVSFTKPKRGARDGIAMTKGEAETLEQVSQREASLGIFHAVGKVVYNKRDDVPPRRPPGSDDDAVDPEAHLPAHLAQHARPKRSQVAADSLIDETGTDTHTFVSALHENYALSCEATGASSDDPRSPTDYLNGCLDALSDADLLCPSGDVFFGSRGSRFSSLYAGRDTGSHVLRQDEMAFHVAVRGMLFALPHPVKRSGGGGGSASSNSAGGGGGGGGTGKNSGGFGGKRGAGGGQDAFKMFYPTSIKLWRAKEEMEALVDLWSTKLLNGEDESSRQRGVADGASRFLRSNQPANSVLSSSSSSPSKYGAGGAAASRLGGSRPGTTTEATATNSDGVVVSAAASAKPLLSLGSAARRELILERLPYMAHMARCANRSSTTSSSSLSSSALGSSSSSASSARLRDLERLVSFHGIGAAGASANDDDDDDAADAVDEGESQGPGAAVGGGEAGAAGGGDESWATDKPSEERTPRRRGVGISRGVERLVVEKLYLSDDDIED